ncbi:MAG: 3'(2'),5'-bisphosphate nucleotidase CysQ [Balneolales bacterium]|nr:3'(2'),5'-bisphosphate nucleotidase CysQ [Balneolales bacterium]
MINKVIITAKQAGTAILKEYKKETSSVVDWKADDSPLTVADTAAHQAIVKGLQESFPDIPVLSEEGKSIPFSERKSWPKYWCVDPMDGTKEFIKKTGQFTVNIALIEYGLPVMGVVYAPAIDLLYYAVKGEGAFKKEKGQEPVKIRAERYYKKESDLSIVASKDHAGPAVKKLFEAYPLASARSMGSSLKFCLIAEGEANLYYRDVPTYEWDTAAAQAIVEEAGGFVLTRNGRPLEYNKENLLNPELITVGKEGKMWVDVIRSLAV